MKFATKAIHAGNKPDEATGSITVPIYQTSTYVQAGLGEHKGFTYSRLKNPSRSALEQNLAALENGKYAYAFSSGMAAVESVIKLLQPGDEVLVSEDLYGGTQRFFTRLFSGYGVAFNYCSFLDAKAVTGNINDKTKLLWLESPTNPLLKIIDIKEIAAMAKANGAMLCVDNTFATPFLQNPLSMGADLVVHSATKYLGGHSDVVLGAVICDDEKLAEGLYAIQSIGGAIPGPQDCFLTLRGIKTLHVRMKAHCENAREVAQFLKGHPKVSHVFWPGFSDHPNHNIAKTQMLDFGGMVSFEFRNNDSLSVRKLFSGLKVFSIAESLGGVESMVAHPASMSHASLSKQQREKVGIQDSLIRLSVGIEDAADLIDDLKNALEQL